MNINVLKRDISNKLPLVNSDTVIRDFIFITVVKLRMILL